MKNKYLPVILISTFFGLIAGLSSFFFLRMNFFENMGLPMFNEIDLNNSNNKSPSIIIRDAKKIVVTQDDKIAEISQNIQKSQIAVFAKSSLKNYRVDNTKPAENYFLPESRIGEGLVLTSDGWILASFSGLDEAAIAKITKNDFVIVSDKKMINIDKIVADDLTGIFLLKIKAIDLPAINLSQFANLKNGQTLVGVNYDGVVSADQLSNRNRITDYAKGSHRLESLRLRLNDSKDMNFYFDLEGNLACFSARGGECFPASLYTSAVKSLSKFSAIKRAAIDVDYIELSQVSLNNDSQNFSTGALVINQKKDQPNISKAKTKVAPILLDGDIIESINGSLIDRDNTLSEILASYLAGDSVSLIIARQGKEIKLEYILNAR